MKPKLFLLSLSLCAFASQVAHADEIPKRGTRLRGDDFSAGMVINDSTEAKAICPLLCQSVSRQWTGRWSQLESAGTGACTCRPSDERTAVSDRPEYESSIDLSDTPLNEPDPDLPDDTIEEIDPDPFADPDDNLDYPQ